VSEVFKSEWFTGSVMTPLQQQVYELGVCASCHTKTMRFIHRSDEAGLTFWQCGQCNRVAMLDATSDNTEEGATNE
jgi:ribosomal protein L37AE/L43A